MISCSLHMPILFIETDTIAYSCRPYLLVSKNLTFLCRKFTSANGNSSVFQTILRSTSTHRLSSFVIKSTPYLSGLSISTIPIRAYHSLTTSRAGRSFSSCSLCSNGLDLVFIKWWAWRGSNPRLSPYKEPTLTAELHARNVDSLGLEPRTNDLKGRYSNH